MSAGRRRVLAMVKRNLLVQMRNPGHWFLLIVLPLVDGLLFGSIGVALDASNGTVRVDVTDTGPGIASADAQRIFSPFVSHDTQGTGLGLPTARRLVDAHGGSIGIKSEAVGTTVTVSLPESSEPG